MVYGHHSRIVDVSGPDKPTGGGITLETGGWSLGKDLRVSLLQLGKLTILIKHMRSAGVFKPSRIKIWNSLEVQQPGSKRENYFGVHHPL